MTAQQSQQQNKKSQSDQRSAVSGIKDANAMMASDKVLSSHALNLGVVGPLSRRFVCEVNKDVTIADITKDSFFTHVAAQFKPFDEIEVRWKNRTHRALLVVHSAGNVWAKVHLVESTKMGTDLTDFVPDGYSIDFDGKGWRVINNQTKSVMKDGFDLDREALAWLNTHIL